MSTQIEHINLPSLSTIISLVRRGVFWALVKLVYNVINRQIYKYHRNLQFIKINLVGKMQLSYIS